MAKVSHQGKAHLPDSSAQHKKRSRSEKYVEFVPGVPQILKISTNLSQQRNEIRKIGKYCDYTLKTKDGGESKVHKIMLAAVSPFFEKIFTFKNDKNNDSMVIPQCSSDVLEKIIEFMYTGKIEITSDIAMEVLNTAYFFELVSLVESCMEVLIESVNSKNCVALLAYSEKYFIRGAMDEKYFILEALAEKCIKTICENIEILKNSSEFLELSIDAMKKLCSCDRSLCNEKQLNLAIDDWVKFDEENREKFVADLRAKIQS